MNLEHLSSQLWWQGLDYLEEQHPKRLAHLLSQGREALVQHLNDLFERGGRARIALREAQPGLSREEIEELTREQWLPENPDQTLEPLPPQVAQRLEQFRTWADEIGSRPPTQPTGTT